MWLVVEQQLQVARLLVQTSDEGPIEASIRRAVSTACYALFQALCDMCAESRVGRGRHSDAFTTIFRALDHGQVAQTLGEDFVANEPTLQRLRSAFKDLKEAREWADYGPGMRPGGDTKTELPFTRDEAVRLINAAEDGIKTIEALNEESRLATRLVTKSRK